MWIIVLLFSCSDDSEFNDEGIIEGEVVLKSGTPQRINSDIILELTGINDSRCPIGVVCSSSGNVYITFEVYNSGASFQHEIKYCEMEELLTDTIEGAVIKIVDIAPYRYPEEEVRLEDYRVTIDVLE